nr:YcxB family protein [Oscillospiraceae bacterium]
MHIEVNLTEEIFRRFTMFDMIRKKKVWRSPVIFASILSVSACICFIMRHVEGAVLLGSVLLLVGLGMPLVYFVSFFSSLRKQILAQGLKRPQKVYTLLLTEKASGIGISNDREHAEYKWKDVHHVYRDQIATYLYMTPARAFILPHTCVEEGPEALWTLIEKKIPKEKRTIL